jgi:hypothetical protein
LSSDRSRIAGRRIEEAKMASTDQNGLTGRTSEAGGHYHNGSWFRDDECHCPLNPSGYAPNTPEYQVWKIAQENGVGAASWVFDGNTSGETYRRVLAGIKACDPLIMDAFRTPSLSGEYADDYSDLDLLRDIGWVEHDGLDLRDNLLDQYSEDVSAAFWAEVERLAKEQVES